MSGSLSLEPLGTKLSKWNITPFHVTCFLVLLFTLIYNYINLLSNHPYFISNALMYISLYITFRTIEIHV